MTGLNARLDRVAEQLGRRGVCLLLVGVAWIGIGVGIEAEPPIREDGVLIIHELMPQWLRAALWATTGAAAVWTGVRARLGRDDTIGFVAIMIMPLERTLSFFVSWAMYGVTALLGRWFPDVEPIGYDRGWYSACVWLIVVLLLQIISGWRNPPPCPLPASDGRQG